MPLSDDEKNAIRESFLVELESEHYQREEEGKSSNITFFFIVSFQMIKRRKSRIPFKSDLRLQFYRSNNYIMGKDHTGRDKWNFHQPNKNVETKGSKRSS